MGLMKTEFSENVPNIHLRITVKIFLIEILLCLTWQQADDT
jgi:hypothetical protein